MLIITKLLTLYSLYYIIDYMKTINALSARSRLGTILDEVSQEGEHYIIERLSRPLVAVIPVSEYKEVFHQRISKKKGELLLEQLAAFRKKYGKRLSRGKGTTNLIGEMRENRTRHLLNLVK